MKTILQYTNLDKICCNYSKSLYPWMLLLLLMSFSACEDFLETDLPNAQLPAEEVFETEETTRAAMAGIYTKLRNSSLLSGTGSGLHVLMGLYADELNYYGNPGFGPDAFENHAVLPSLQTLEGIWNNAYNIIFEANTVIEGVSNSNGLTDQQKQQFTGEALFIRALMHFELTKLFGAIPYITTTDYRLNAVVTKSPQEQIFDKTKEDFLMARNMLAENYSTAERIIPNKWVAEAFLARLYLYTEDWNNAITSCTAILNQSNLYQWPTELDEVFVKNSTATLWHFKPAAEGVNTLEGSTFILQAGPPLNVALNATLVEAMEAQDLRRDSWIGEVTNGQQVWYFPYKYKQQQNTGVSQEYSIVFRMAEVYLIRAEAYANQGNATAAQQDINRIRSRAGLPDILTTGQPLLEAIAHERRVELFTEFGHRWFDLVRSGTAAQVLSPIKPGWQPTNTILPLPEAELLRNPNLLPQNPGY